MIITKDFIIGCLQSGYDIATRLVFRKKREVIFAAPQHFNRSKNGKNPYFEKLISYCRENNISYLMLESPEYGNPQPRDPDAVRIDIIFWLMMLLRKIGLRIHRGNERKSMRFTSKIINILTFGGLRSASYITMAGLFIEIFQEMSPKAKVYDLQHGIIYAGHPGYFEHNGEIAQSLSATNCKILVWGEGFKHLFKRPAINNIREDKVIVLGYPIELDSHIPSNQDRKTIVFSLQFTHDIEHEKLQLWKDMLDDALSMIDYNKYTVKLKNHPRHNNAIDLTDILDKYPNVVITNEILEDLVSDCFLHVTWSSTTCFEFASFGIPTAILYDSRDKTGYDIYYSQFGYPVFKRLSLTEIIHVLSDTHKMDKISESVREWYYKLYAPINQKVVKTIIGGNAIS